MTDEPSDGPEIEVDPRVIQLIMAMRRRGVSDDRVLSAIERTPRHVFLPLRLQDMAYEDAALPIECGQTISQPFVVAYMTEQAEIGERDKVLEVGTGSGYQTAILSQLARRVYSIERHRELLKQAEQRFRALGLNNVTAMAGDGSKGWPAQAPFDRIIVTAASVDRPDPLLEQLKEGGVMIAPVGQSGAEMLMRYRRTADGVAEESLIPVRFVPLIEGPAVD